MTETRANRVHWLVDKLEATEIANDELTARCEELEAQVESLAKSDREADEKLKRKNIAYESAIRQIVNNPTMKREDVQGRLLTILQDNGAM
jgi:chaperonin cofactor prefoldin